MTGIYSAPASTEMSRDKRFLFIVRNPSIYTRVIGQNLSNTDEIGLGCLFFLQQSLYPKTNPRLCHPLSENRGHVCRQPGIELPDSDTTIYLSICPLRKDATQDQAYCGVSVRFRPGHCSNFPHPHSLSEDGNTAEPPSTRRQRSCHSQARQLSTWLELNWFSILSLYMKKTRLSYPPTEDGRLITLCPRR